MGQRERVSERARAAVKNESVEAMVLCVDSAQQNGVVAVADGNHGVVCRQMH